MFLYISLKIVLIRNYEINYNVSRNLRILMWIWTSKADTIFYAQNQNNNHKFQKVIKKKIRQNILNGAPRLENANHMYSEICSSL